MRKGILLAILAIAAMQPLTAQRYNGANSGWWVDIQAVQNFGINKWSDTDYVNDGFPRTSLTELRGVFNAYLISPSLGAFVDMGLGVMPAPPMKSFDARRLPKPDSAHDYYVRRVSESGESRANAHFRISAGLFGEVYATQRIAVMPYIGVGGITMTRRTFNVGYKEDGSNMEYDTKYIWGRKSGGEFDGNGEMLGYFTARVNLRYELDPRTNLLIGLEYTHLWDSTHFYEQHTSVFNKNVQRKSTIKCNKMNMLGISVGVSFR